MCAYHFWSAAERSDIGTLRSLPSAVQRWACTETHVIAREAVLVHTKRERERGERDTEREREIHREREKEKEKDIEKLALRSA